jgi:hypothetical protein
VTFGEIGVDLYEPHARYSHVIPPRAGESRRRFEFLRASAVNDVTLSAQSRENANPNRFQQKFPLRSRADLRALEFPNRAICSAGVIVETRIKTRAKEK